MPTYTFAASAEVVLYLRATAGAGRRRPATANVAAGGRRGGRSPTDAGDRGRPHRRACRPTCAACSTSPGDIPVVEDTAHAFPSPIAAFDGRFAGTIGRAGAFSFYATKTITTGEGGMLATDDAALADRARTMRLHGIGRDAWKRYTAAGSWYYEIEAAGLQGQPDRPRRGHRAGPARTGGRAPRRAGGDRPALSRRPRADSAATGASSCRAGGDDPAHAWHLFVDPARSRRARRPRPSTPSCRASPVCPPPLQAARVAASSRDRRARRGRHRCERAFHPAPPPPALPADGLPAGPVPECRGGLRRRDQPADLARA